MEQAQEFFAALTAQGEGGRMLIKAIGGGGGRGRRTFMDTW